VAQCEWTSGQNRCERDAQPDESRCIFHLPLGNTGKPVDEFWRHFANYYMAQLARVRETLPRVHDLWVFGLLNEDLVRRYSDRCMNDDMFDYRGFVFPAMDRERNLRGFVFAAADFTEAQFAPRQMPENPLPEDGIPLHPRKLSGEPDMSEPPLD
jgi:hypothetical protein